LVGVEEGVSDSGSSDADQFGKIDHIDVNFSQSAFLPRQIFRDSMALGN